MKRTLSLVLALVMVLGSFSSVFAVEAVTPQTAGEFLQEVGVLEGNASGDLMLGDSLTRQDTVILLSKLMGEFEVAKGFPTAPSYKDITIEAYSPFLAWAEANKTFVGKAPAQFGFGDLLATDEYARVLLVVLGYGDVEWKDTLDKAEELGLLADIDVDAKFLRGNMAVMTLNALGTKIKDSTETLADKLEIEMPAPELSKDIEITSAVAIANNKVEVKVKEEVAASVADFVIVKKGSTTVVEVKDVVKESAKVFVLETEALVGGTSYTVTSNGKTINFTGLAADTTAPTVVKISATDTNRFVVEYSDRMDFASATNAENYTMNKDIKVVKATLNADRTKVTLTTDAAKRNVVYTLVIQNVMNSDAKVITKTTRTITATEDRIAPRVTTLQVQNNRMIIVKFDDANGMDKAALEAVENYTINDLEITSVKAYDVDANGLIETVVLMTADQTANKSYTLTMENLIDGSVLANPLGKTTRGFRGASADKTSPTVKPGTIKAYNNNIVEIEFTENNAMDAASLEDISNYVITFGNNEVLPVLSAEAWDTTYPDGYSERGVTLTTAQQEINKAYRIEVKGVQDEFGNALKPVTGTTYAKYNFTGVAVDTQPPYVAKVEYVNPTMVKLHFSERLVKATAIDPTNFVINKDIGSAIKARLLPGNVVELTTQTLANNTSYTVTINDVEDLYGNVVSNAKANFIATASSLDVTAPSITYIYAANEQEIHVNLDEYVESYPDPITVREIDGNGAFVGTVKTFNYSGTINDGTTIVYKANAAVDNLKLTNYKIETMTGTFVDEAGNKYVLPTVDSRFLFNGNEITNDAPEIEYIEQINAKRLKVVFTEPVAKRTGAPLTATVTTDDTHLTEWYYNVTSNFVVGRDYPINFTALAEDLVGLGVRDEADTNTDPSKSTIFVPYYEDITKPVITGVTATNNKTVVITYDENVTTGSYKIYYLNDRNQPVYVYTGGGSNRANEITISNLTQTLKGDYIYYLEPVSGAVDTAGNREDVTGVKFDFPGTDVKVEQFVTGVAIINAKKVTVSATKAIASVKVYEESTVGLVIGNVSDAVYFNSTRTVATLDNLVSPVLSGTKYVAYVEFVDGTPAQSYTFAGITPDLGIGLINGTDLKLDFAGFTTDLFKVAVYDAAGNEVVAKRAIGNVAPVDPKQIAATPLAAGDYYVVLFDQADDTRVLYAAKVTLQ
ncbi:Ig-like domain-containing protein [Tissierella sp.]|uniref:Ig-like domain-containing protein n=1 Tax=Tissierella sp. TaxID=41274 RepID=UPI0028557554|nr:Ig-like domain-containing protein [Tissierella sp.]MDR7857555.1 Ig-like domain-containing protein [Tissierella sp.]